MLATSLRIEFLVAALVFLAIVVVVVRRYALQLGYALVWIAAALAMLLMAIFPDTVLSLGPLLGFEATSNFIFFVAIIFLLVLVFGLMVTTSRQSGRIRILVQELSAIKYELERTQKLSSGPAGSKEDDGSAHGEQV